ncbi:fluoride efflux transporter CrcB [Haloechinothrix sp. YIM 98757]|uniref:Fluoride-specific ion channel FluC n=1 Tax=Haloechinothrix aidingensis TaxID=2752311 RepID=A0A838A686_9PSEU|nr:fluoride efflux transporter CrcB [Haloechinothrix aidingensis]
MSGVAGGSGPSACEPGRSPWWRRWAAGKRWDVLVAVGLGGAAGTGARYAVAVGMPHPAGGFPFATLLVNVVGCFLIGMLVVVIAETVASHRLVRPFLGVGVLGGFTTFSTYTVDTAELVMAERAGTALVYLASTVLAALAAVVAGVLVTRRLVRVTRRFARRGSGTKGRQR